MKHTKHALTYLRRQYSAVLKHAYALGIAATFVFGLSLIERYCCYDCGLRSEYC